MTGASSIGKDVVIPTVELVYISSHNSAEVSLCKVFSTTTFFKLATANETRTNMNVKSSLCTYHTFMSVFVNTHTRLNKTISLHMSLEILLITWHIYHWLRT